MPKRQVFYSFHYDNDVMRVQQIRNIGVIEGNTPISVNEWEQIRRRGDSAIENWIDDNMKYRSCVIVLIGSETASRKWVQYEIKKGWSEGKGLLGIYIHNIRCPRNGICNQGTNPFNQFNINNVPLPSIIRCYNPSSYDAYNDISRNIEILIEDAIR